MVPIALTTGRIGAMTAMRATQVGAFAVKKLGPKLRTLPPQRLRSLASRLKIKDAEIISPKSLPAKILDVVKNNPLTAGLVAWEIYQGIDAISDVFGDQAPEIVEAASSIAGATADAVSNVDTVLGIVDDDPSDDSDLQRHQQMVLIRKAISFFGSFDRFVAIREAMTIPEGVIREYPAAAARAAQLR